MCFPEKLYQSILPLHKELEFPERWRRGEGGGGEEVGDFTKPKNLKKCLKPYQDFQRDGDVLEKKKVWIFSGTMQ